MSAALAGRPVPGTEVGHALGGVLAPPLGHELVVALAARQPRCPLISARSLGALRVELGPLPVPCDAVHVVRNLRTDQTASQVGHDRLRVTLERVTIAAASSDALDPDLSLGDRGGGDRRVCDFILAG